MTPEPRADEPTLPAPPADEDRVVPAVVAPAEGEGEQHPLVTSELGSGLLEQQPTAEAHTIAVLKVCPQCGTEYETAARFCPADGTALRPKGSDSLVGRVIAERYHILKLIGEGGMGRVYLGEHVKMNRQCAIKVMSPSLVNDTESAARFAREASSAARIIHPNVAAVFDYGESDGLVYLVMEYVDGEPLSRLLAREAPFTLERAVELARQIADGLGAAHELGIVHRDLKPDNILVSRKQNGREAVKVVDFGIAKAMQENAGEALTRTGLVIGTPEFMSPEQLLGDPVDARSDLYGLGCILHLMLTATPAFEAPTREQMIKRRLSENPPSVQVLDPGLPDAIDAVVKRLLARTPGERFASAAEVRDALSGSHVRRVGADGVSELPRMSTPRSAPTQILDVEPAPSRPPPAARTASRRTTPRMAASRIAGESSGGKLRLLVGLLVAAALIWFLAGHLRERSARERIALAKVDSLNRVRDSARQAESLIAAGSGVTMIDSAAAARKRQQDSLNQMRQALRTGVSAAIRRYTDAVQRGDIAGARAAFPNVPESELQKYQRLLQTNDVRIELDRPGSLDPRLSQNDSAATVDIVLRDEYIDRRLRQRISGTPMRWRATLVRQGTGWQLAALVPQ